ncbi:hypothetical protein Pst134EA_004995 [Puccinia striiformis f. sp. tritici]|uniref:hypothetical protein n=1 Tax=Puccinia striiformis f. sp. tritici TaxID=168172 RepID=UPI0020087E5C|nr:hypothetical protein Pst134EA_004995 [Puccinia striiformis f. sp. tritici]KAH9471087.1 hypothetical protein Pst134EA_004995 [Puccinia striiformis f. sp. tritici]
MAPNDTTNSAEGNEDGGSGGNDADSQAPLSKEEESIASIICNLIPKYQDQSGGASMETDEPAGAGGQSSNPTNKPAPLPKEPQLSTEFTVKQAQIEKSKIEDAAAKEENWASGERDGSEEIDCPTLFRAIHQRGSVLHQVFPWWS